MVLESLYLGSALLSDGRSDRDIETYSNCKDSI